MTRQREGLPVVLVAEDNEAHQLILAAALRRAGVDATLRFVSDGEELLEYLQRAGRYEREEALAPEVVLLDLNMPGVDGFEALRRIRGNDVLRGLPVVVLSTADTAATVDLAYRLGANSYLVKLMDFDAFVAQMRHFADFWFEAARVPGPVM